MPLSRSSCVLRIGACVMLLVVLVLMSPGIGTESGRFGWQDAWRARLGLAFDDADLLSRPGVDWDGDGVLSDNERGAFVAQARHIGFGLRFPRTWLALQVGATLALCGCTFQVLFRNPLATPYTLGIASGGSLGAVLAIKLGLAWSVLGFSAVGGSAFLGAMFVVAIVFAIARSARRLTSNELLLAGVTVGLFCSAMMMLVMSISTERVTFEMIRWTFGSLDPITSVQRMPLLLFLLPSWVVLVWFAPAMNQYRIGSEIAASRGVNTASLRFWSILVCTLATAAVVARCGPIGFVGLVVPHGVALLVGSDCRILLPASALVGAAFLVLCDWASQLSMRLVSAVGDYAASGATLPIGVVTAVIGVPIFLVLLQTRIARR